MSATARVLWPWQFEVCTCFPDAQADLKIGANMMKEKWQMKGCWRCHGGRRVSQVWMLCCLVIVSWLELRHLILKEDTMKENTIYYNCISLLPSTSILVTPTLRLG